MIGVGLITDPQQAEAALENGDADLIALARAVLYESALAVARSGQPWRPGPCAVAVSLRSEPHGLKGTLLPNR